MNSLVSEGDFILFPPLYRSAVLDIFASLLFHPFVIVILWFAFIFFLVFFSFALLSFSPWYFINGSVILLPLKAVDLHVIELIVYTLLPFLFSLFHFLTAIVFPSFRTSV